MWSVLQWCTCAVPSSQKSIVLYYIETLRAEAHKAWFSGAENAVSMETYLQHDRTSPFMCKGQPQ